MDLSIILLNYKNRGLIKQSLRNLLPNKLSLAYEVFVVDNNSHDGCIAMVNKLFPTVKTISSRANVGFSAGNNLALKEAGGDFVLLLNPDVAVIPEVIVKLWNFMKRDPKIGIAAPRLINPDGSIQDSCCRWPRSLTPIYRRTFLKRLPGVKSQLDWYLMKDFDHLTKRPVAWTMGACLLVRAEAMKKVGLMDERYFMYFEDIDWCRRFWLKGFKVYYYPDSEMVHYHRRLSAEYDGLRSIFNKSMYFHTASWIKYQLKYLGQPNPKIH